jgi:nucleoside-diphosphate-sugar epimerase
MRVFVTGGTGFIGWRLVHKLLRRGHSVWALARSEAGADRLQQAGATVVGAIYSIPSQCATLSGTVISFTTCRSLVQARKAGLGDRRASECNRYP